MQVVSHYHPDGDESMEMDDRPVNDWDWQAVGDKHDIDGLKTWLSTTKRAEGDAVGPPSTWKRLT